MKFTGERMIPKSNKGMEIFYDHIIRYIFSSSLTSNKTVIDVGCGEGYGSYILAEMGASKVLGVDISKEAISYAVKKYSSKKVTFLQADLEKDLDVRSKYDVAVSFEVIEHLMDQQQYLNNIKKMLNKDGVLLVSTPNVTTYPKGNPYHKNEINIRKFENTLISKFKYVNIYEQNMCFSDNIIRKDEKHTVNLDKLRSNLRSESAIVYTVNNAKPKYFIAVCSDIMLNDLKSVRLNIDKVDGLDLNKMGVEGLIASIRENGIYDSVFKENKRLLDEITSSKFYKYWQKYNDYKKLIKKYIH